MIRRISTKWALAVLVAVIVPFTGLAWYVNGFVRTRVADEFVQYHLLSHAYELGERLDRMISERRQDLRVLASVPDLSQFVIGRDSDREIFETVVARELFDGLVVEGGVYEYILMLDAQGRALVMNQSAADGSEVDDYEATALKAVDWSREPWFQRCLDEGSALVDWRRLDLLRPPSEGAEPTSEEFHIGFAHRVAGEDRASDGVVLAFLNWSLIQAEIEEYGTRRDEVGTGAAEELYRSSYAWIWADDADTIIGHKDRGLYGQSIAGLDLEFMSEAARASDWGMYPDYVYRGTDKKAAYRHTRSRADGGFGWIVGVGVDDEDIYRPVRTITANLVKATLFVLLLSALITLVVARRTTRPIQDLQSFTRRVAGGDLDAQVPAGGHDELGDLARSFNRMTRELKENRQQLIAAEKDAAWREMARQVAHEIKNPLTPLRLSADLLERAHAQGSDEFESILDRTIGVVRRQCDHMREIATDFHALAGKHREPRTLDLGESLDDVLQLHDAWGREAGVEVRRGGSGALVLADPEELRRALVNLDSNALEAMPEGGVLEADVRRNDESRRAILELRDTGVGLDDDVRARLFEPYFTTRSSGTGLGLAIVRRIVEDLGGSVSLENREPGPGAVARIELPLVDGSPEAADA